MATGKKRTVYTLYLLRNARGEFYSPRSTGRGWNRAGKFLTAQQLAAVPLSIKKQAIAVEAWTTTFLSANPAPQW